MSRNCLPAKGLTEKEKQEFEKAHERFFKCLMMKKDEVDDMFNSGIFNEIAIGYGKIALEMLGIDSKFLGEFERAMKRAFDLHTTDYARKIYNRIEG